MYVCKRLRTLQEIIKFQLLLIVRFYDSVCESGGKNRYFNKNYILGCNLAPLLPRPRPCRHEAQRTVLIPRGRGQQDQNRSEDALRPFTFVVHLVLGTRVDGRSRDQTVVLSLSGG